MKKIPTIFVRDMNKQPALVIPEWKTGCEWVRDGEGIATRKYDGTCCLIQDGKLFRRRELKQGQPAPAEFEQVDFDEETGKTVGWVPVGDGDEDKWHREAFQTRCDHGLIDRDHGTYELVGPKINGNKEESQRHILIPHAGAEGCFGVPRTFDGIKTWLIDHPFKARDIEGLVWHHPDGRMAKIKRRDFGLKW